MKRSKKKYFIRLIESIGYSSGRQKVDGKLNVMPEKFVLALKHKDTGEPVLRARFVIDRHRD